MAVGHWTIGHGDEIGFAPWKATFLGSSWMSRRLSRITSLHMGACVYRDRARRTALSRPSSNMWPRRARRPLTATARSSQPKTTWPTYLTIYEAVQQPCQGTRHCKCTRWATSCSSHVDRRSCSNAMQPSSVDFRASTVRCHRRLMRTASTQWTPRPQSIGDRDLPGQADRWRVCKRSSCKAYIA